MRILLLAPHPFYQERGTPLAVDLLLRVLSARGDRVDVLTYAAGEDVHYPGVTLHRIPRLPLVRRVPPGLSLKKLVCDAAMAGKLLALTARERYDLIHANEEAVFLAMAVRRLRRVPYVYDMDSSLPQQVVEKAPALRPLAPLMRWRERRAIRGALAVVPVCDALAEVARRAGAPNVFLLRDVSLLEGAPWPLPDGLRGELGLRGPCFMYVGNLEHYQGVELLLDSFAALLRRVPDAALVIAGGSPAHVCHYTERAGRLGVSGSVRFLGPQPLSRMAALFGAADVLVSPRLKGANTPMKIYSYLDSGKAVLATDLPTHTQVLTPDVALLAPPRAEAFAEAMARLAGDPALRARLGARGRDLARREYSQAAYDRAARALYGWLEERLHPAAEP
jgi:glycosyltransferase involved in cell wall biosynthesis